MLRRGRAWLYIGERQCFGGEWVFFSRGNGPSLRLALGGPGGEHEFDCHVSVPFFFALYFHADRLWPRRIRERVHAWWFNSRNGDSLARR